LLILSIPISLLLYTLAALFVVAVIFTAMGKMKIFFNSCWKPIRAILLWFGNLFTPGNEVSYGRFLSFLAFLDLLVIQYLAMFYPHYMGQSAFIVDITRDTQKYLALIVLSGYGITKIGETVTNAISNIFSSNTTVTPTT